ncbi:MAG: hemerythrin domain-containing protein [Bacteroidota bacterium]
MAKRHASLVPLSHDHHHGLALALRLRQGTNALLNDGWTHDRREQAKRVLDFYHTELRPHFAAEEEVVFPMMKEHMPGSQGKIETLVDQHRQIEDIIARIRIAQDDALNETLVSLGVLLEQHIRIEERELFPLYESGISEELADETGQRVSLVLDRYRLTDIQHKGQSLP